MRASCRKWLARRRGRGALECCVGFCRKCVFKWRTYESYITRHSVQEKDREGENYPIFFIQRARQDYYSDLITNIGNWWSQYTCPHVIAHYYKHFCSVALARINSNLLMRCTRFSWERLPTSAPPGTSGYLLWVVKQPLHFENKRSFSEFKVARTSPIYMRVGYVFESRFSAGII